MLLEIEALQSGYNKAQILWDVNLEVAEGEVVSLLGMNGAGKTTTLRTASGLLPTWSGDVRFDGRSIASLPVEARAALGLAHVPEGRGIFSTMTVGQNLWLGATVRKDSRAQVRSDADDLLDVFPALKGRLDEPASSLSGGQQQMLAMARALLGKPRLLVVDELSFGLSPKLVQDLFGLISTLRTEGTTFLLVEQHASVLEISDRTYALSGGRTVLSEKSSDLIGTDKLVRSYVGDQQIEGRDEQ